MDAEFSRLGLSEAEQEKLKQMSADVCSAYGKMAQDMLDQLQPAMQNFARYVHQALEVFNLFDYPYPTRAEIRAWKHERRQARHNFMSHGKHGLKRPRGKRKAV